MVKLDDIQTVDFTVTRKGTSGAPTFLPEPDRRRRRCTVISVDDHLVEPPDMFAGRLPSTLADRAPRVVTTDNGGEVWVYGGAELPNVGFNAVAGRPVSEYSWEPTRFDEMRRGAWDIDARVHDMDINGIFASVNFPSFLCRFLRLSPAAGPRRRPRARRCSGVEQLPPGGIGRHSPRAHHPAARSRGCSTRGLRRRKFTATPNEVSAPSRSPSRPIRWICRRCIRTAGTRSFVPARRRRPWCVCTSVRREQRLPRPTWRAARGEHRPFRHEHHGRRRLAVCQDPAALPRHQNLPVGGRHWLGAATARPT